MAPPRVAREQQRARVVSKKMQNHNERSTARFSDLRNCFPANNNLKWKHICSYTCGPRSQRLASPNAVARNNLLWPRTLCCEAITVPPKRGGCDCLGTHFRRNRGLTNTQQRTHRTPPLSSSTPSQDPATCSTSLTSPSRLRSWALHLHTTVVRTLATRHQQGENSLLGRMPWVFKRRHRTLHACGYLNGARSVRPQNESCSQKVAEKHGGIFPR